MFKLWKISEDEEYEESVTVYAVRDDKNGYPYFLIYENGGWKYVSAKYFTPLNM